MAFGFGKKKKELEDWEEEEEELPPLPGLPEEEFAEEEFEAAPVLKPEPFIGARPEFGEVPPPRPVPSMRAPEVPLKRAPVFIKIDKYKELMKTVHAMEDKIAELEDTLGKISSIKSKERDIIEGLGALLSEAKGKVTEVSSKILKPEA